METDKLGSVMLVLHDILRLHAFGVIPVKISDQDHSDPAWCIRGTDELTLEKDSSVSLMQDDLDRPIGMNPKICIACIA